MKPLNAMTKSASSLPNESHLSRSDIELLARIDGNQQALMQQVNTMQIFINPSD